MKNNTAWFGLSVNEALKVYKQVYSHKAILQANYAVSLRDIYGVGKGIAWFGANFPIGLLATDVDFALGSLDAESFYAGAYQANYMTQQSEDTLDITFIETKDGAIANSYQACEKLVVNDDGTLNEPKKYTFALMVNVFKDKRIVQDKHIAFSKSWLVSVKEGACPLSSTGRSEVIKHNITFQKIRPYHLFK